MTKKNIYYYERRIFECKDTIRAYSDILKCIDELQKSRGATVPYIEALESIRNIVLNQMKNTITAMRNYEEKLKELTSEIENARGHKRS